MTFIIHLSQPGLNVEIDRTARLVAMRPGLPMSGCIMARGMTETLWQPEFDGEYLRLDAYGLVAVRGWIMRHDKRRWTAAARQRRFTALVTSHGLRDAMLCEIDRLLAGEPAPYGEPSFVRQRVLAQLQAGADHVRSGPRWPAVQARLAAAQL